MIVFISLLVSHKVCIHIEYSFREVRNKLQKIVSSVNEKKIKSSRKENMSCEHTLNFDQ